MKYYTKSHAARRLALLVGSCASAGNWSLPAESLQVLTLSLIVATSCGLAIEASIGRLLQRLIFREPLFDRARLSDGGGIVRRADD
jgi:hypothetical protein